MSTNAALAGCVASLKQSNESLGTSISILNSAVTDYPRVQRVLRSYRHFELTSNASVANAQSSLANEIEPEVMRLLSMTDEIIARMERKEKGLKSRAELQEGRIAGYSKEEKEKAKPKPKPKPVSANNRANAERLKILKAKKERIAYAVERMELELKQKQREMKQTATLSGVD